jgi:hypothetical protein
MDFRKFCPPPARQCLDPEGLTASGAVIFPLQMDCLTDITNEFDRCMRAAIAAHDPGRILKVLSKAEALYQGYADIGFDALAPIAASVRQTLYLMHRAQRRWMIKRVMTHPDDLDVPQLISRLETYQHDDDFMADIAAAKRKVADPSFHMLADLEAQLPALD